MLKTRLRELRETKGVSREDMAAHLDVSPATIKFWEIGVRSPSEKRIREIASYHGISMAEFYAREDEVK